ncbi:hypothetical protein B0H11DRAFT_2282213 [Mycena galericulata]|nr:hypothetical protein B0H11DRAFT_2282213 [Mycena galericulata]
MLWLPLARKTRSGNEFSPFSTITALRAEAFDFAPLLAEAIRGEGRGEYDQEEAQESPDDPPLERPAPPLDPFDAVDDIKASPAPKPRRTAFGDLQDGKKPLPSISRSHKRRKHSRAANIRENGHTPRTSTIRDYVGKSAPIPTSLNTEKLPAAHGGYAAKAADAWGSKKRRSVADFLGLGFTVVKWNGIDPRPLIDAQGRVFAVLAGQPNAARYADSVAAAYRAIRDAGAAANFSSEMRKHRRGLYAVVNVGLSYGKGQTIPSRLHHRLHGDMAEGLLANEHVCRMAHFASATFALWAPRLYQYYLAHDRDLHQHHLRQRLPHLRRPFAKSVFSSAAFNFGPSVWTFRHRDVLNVPFGWCAVQALGEFDPVEGGHLALWDLKLLVEFPAGALILLPSATIAHSNVPAQDGDKRISFTQYTPGGLIRYVDNGFRTEAALEREDPIEFARLAALKDSRWVMGLGLLSTLDELLPDEGFLS